MPSDAHDGLASIRWYWRDWRASTARGLLPPVARCAYLELLFAQWGSADCTLPDDDRKLALLAGLTPGEWASVRDAVLEWLPVVAQGVRRNSRMFHEWSKAVSLREDARASGRRGGLAAAAARRGQPGGQGTLQGAYRMPIAVPLQLPASDSQSREEEDRKRNARANGAGAIVEKPGPGPQIGKTAQPGRPDPDTDPAAHQAWVDGRRREYRALGGTGA